MIRSLLFAPANRPDLVAKFPRFGADCCVIDLEDGTPAGEKASARRGLRDAVDRVRAAGLQGLLAIRVNVPGSAHHADDLAAAFACDVDAVVLPKLESAGQAEPAARWIERLDAERPRARARMLIGGIESAKGVLQAADTCLRTASLGAVYFGAEDVAADVGGRRTRRGDEVLAARSWVLMAARAAGVMAIDQAVVDIRDDALFLDDAANGRNLGYQGKICVSPGQVKLAHSAFSPTQQERAFAARLVAACEAAAARGLGTIDFEGRMVDEPLLRQARQVLSLPEDGA